MIRALPLSDLLASDLPPEIGSLSASALTADSRAVAPGTVFFALRGGRADGFAFADQAAAGGAVAIVTDRADAPPSIGDVPVVIVAEARRALALAAARLYPAQPAHIAAVTGTSGKTSVAAFTRQIFAQAGFAAASIGTIGVVRPSGEVQGGLTTPDPVTLHAILDELAGEGVTHCAFEASSHGLDQHRLDGVRIQAAAFTNLSRDHLDYHPTMEAYAEAKLRLFTDLLPSGGTAVFVDGDWSAPFVRAAQARGQHLLRIGGPGADIAVLAVAIEAATQIVRLEAFGRSRTVRLPLIGRFQVDNALVAAALAIGCGLSDDAAFAALDHLEGAPGRLDFVGAVRGAPVVVDYAHKPDALDKVLDATRPFASNRLVVVFGCGGDRDAGKRPIMGRIAADKADRVIVTDDNPRSENPAAIRRAILEAAPGAEEIGDRRAAIFAAVRDLGVGDLLVIAGKGHEPGQTIAGITHPFSDHEVAREAIAAAEVGPIMAAPPPVVGAPPLWTGEALAAAMEGRAVGVLPDGVTDISIDSRTLGAGEAYVAIRGHVHDGHAFVGAALARGASLAVVAEGSAEADGPGPLIVVDDPLAGLERAGRTARRRSEARIVAVTGSVGKTSTKEALAHVLSRVGDTHAPPKSFNNHIGVPLTLARMPAGCRFAVFEIGMNHSGEITPLTAMVRPHVGVITTIEAVHIENLGSIEAIADAKAELFSGLEPGGAVVLPRDNPHFNRLAGAAKARGITRMLSFGADPAADVRLASIALDSDGSDIEASIRGRSIAYRLGSPGRHLAMNSLAVLAAADLVGVPVATAAAALADMRAVTGRGERIRLSLASGEVLLIDESYNANPVSMRAAFAVTGATAPGPGGRRIAVLGDMLELGAETVALHAGLAGAIVEQGIDHVFASGPLMAHLAAALPASVEAVHRDRPEDLEPLVAGELRAGDIVMVKGSRGSRMAPLVAALKSRYPRAADEPAGDS